MTSIEQRRRQDVAGATGTIGKQGRAARLALVAIAGLVLLALTTNGAQAANAGLKPSRHLSMLAQSSNVKVQCATDIFKFKPSQILDNTMNNPGKDSQSININLDFDAVDLACNGLFVRKASVLPQLIRHGRIIDENPIRMPLLQGRGFNYATTAGLLDFNSLHQPARDWQPGDKARFELKLEEISIQAKRVVDSVTKIEPIKVVQRQ
jgi:hypothetical protein